MTTTRGTIEADRLVVTPGAWAPRLLAELGTELGVRMVVTRQLVCWFLPSGDPASYEPGRHPIFIWARPPLHPYGFPALDGPEAGMKVGLHHHGGETDPDELDHRVTPDEVATVAEAFRELAPTLPGTFVRALACLYTTTPDHHFVIGAHPSHEHVSVACGFSGHGFKFVPVVGEVLADLALEGSTKHPTGLFDPTRFVG